MQRLVEIGKDIELEDKASYDEALQDGGRVELEGRRWAVRRREVVQYPMRSTFGYVLESVEE